MFLLINLYRIYALDRQKGWISYTILYNEEEIQETINNMNYNKYSRAFVVGRDIQGNCDIPMFSVEIEKPMILTRKCDYNDR